MPTILDVLRVGKPDERLGAAWNLDAVGASADEAVPAPIAALGDETADVRRAAAKCLGRYGPDAGSATPALVRLGNDTDLLARSEAMQALGVIRKARPPLPRPGP